jgi:hypothetical protein
MKTMSLAILLTLSFSVLAKPITSVPFYFAVTEDGHHPLTDNSWTKIPVKEVSTDKAYLRGYYFSENTVASRKKAFSELLEKGVVKTGDIVLSFRPSWEKTIPYAHIQMGVSHAGLAYVDNGVVKNLDMPLDADYNGVNLSGGFDSKHYLEATHLQVIRPRYFSEEQKKNLLSWIQVLKKNYNSIRGKGLLRFNTDYSAAKIDNYSEDDAFVTTLARILLGQDTTSKDLTMFCSEYVWALLSLSNCSPGDAEILNPTVKDASCVKPVFEAMYMSAEGNVPGLTEGPLAILKALDISDSQKEDLMAVLFTQGNMSGLSAGHRALATNPHITTLVEALKVLYSAKLLGNDVISAAVSGKINPPGGRNYSPTSYIINSLLDSKDPERKMDYVATIIFGN